jgi:hypothetical protein
MKINRLIKLPILIAIALMLAACSGSDGPVPSSGSPQAPTSGTPSPGATSTPEKDALPTPTLQSSEGDSSVLLETESPHNGAVVSSPAVTINVGQSPIPESG